MKQNMMLMLLVAFFMGYFFTQITSNVCGVRLVEGQNEPQNEPQNDLQYTQHYLQQQQAAAGAAAAAAAQQPQPQPPLLPPLLPVEIPDLPGEAALDVEQPVFIGRGKTGAAPDTNIGQVNTPNAGVNMNMPEKPTIQGGPAFSRANRGSAKSAKSGRSMQYSIR